MPRAIAAACTRPERVAGYHFFNPAPVMKVVEVVAGLRRTALLAGPLLATVALAQAIAVVERYLGSQLAPGSLSLLAYAMKLNLLPVVIRYATRRGNQRGLHNVRFAVKDAEAVMSAYVPPASVAEVKIKFKSLPDWLNVNVPAPTVF